MSRRAIALLLSPLGLVIISVGRLLIISDYNTTTATAVASSTGYVNTLLGTLIPLVPAFIPYIALLLLLLRQFVLSIIAFAFTAFIAPTPFAKQTTRYVVLSDTRQLFAQMLDHWPFGLAITVIAAAVIGVAVWIYLGSAAEALAALLVLAIVVTLLFTPLVVNLPGLYQVSSNDKQIITQISGPHPSRMVVTLLIILALLVLPYITTPQGAVTAAVAAVAALALFPYVTNFYPTRGGNYYVNAVRTPWLPPEKITTSSGRAYYGYVLEATTKWFTVLRSKNRKIVYIPAKDVIRRSPCEPAVQAQDDRITQPIANTFYQPSAHLKVCADSKHLKHHVKRHTPVKKANRHPRRPTRVPPSSDRATATTAVPLAGRDQRVR